MDIDNLKERLKGFGDRVQNGLRDMKAGWTTSPGAAPQAPPVQPEPLQIAPKQGQVVQPSGPTINIDSSGNARMQGQTLRSPNLGANPNIPPGGMSPEAAALRSAPAAPPTPAAPVTPASPTVPTTPPAKPGMLRGAVGTVARAATPIIAGMGALDAIQNGPGDMDRTIGQEVIGGDQRGNSPYGMMGSAVAATSNVARRIGNAAVPNFLIENAGDKLVGGLRDIAKGNTLGTTKFNADPRPAPAINPTVTQAEPSATQTTSTTAPTGLRTDQGVMSPEAMMRGNAVPNPGYGAITTNGKTRGLRPSGYTPEEIGYLHGRDNPGGGSGATDISALRGLAKQGAFGNIAALGAYGAIDRLNSNATNAGLRSQQIASTNSLKLAEMARADQQKKIENDRADRNELRQDREFANKTGNEAQKDNEAEIENRARDQTALINPGLLKDRGGQEYKDTLAKNSAKLKSDYEFSLQQQGKSLKTATARDIQKLHLADELQSRAVSSREGWRKRFGDYFGTGRFNSRDKHDFLPKSIEPSPIPGTKWLVLRSGEKVPVHEAAGGGFNWTGPNDPVDKQLMEIIKESTKDSKKAK